MSDTPRTNERHIKLSGNWAMCYGIMVEFARQLERELAAATEERDAALTAAAMWEATAKRNKSDCDEAIQAVEDIGKAAIFHTGHAHPVLALRTLAEQRDAARAKIAELEDEIRCVSEAMESRE